MLKAVNCTSEVQVSCRVISLSGAPATFTPVRGLSVGLFARLSPWRRGATMVMFPSEVTQNGVSTDIVASTQTRPAVFVLAHSLQVGSALFVLCRRWLVSPSVSHRRTSGLIRCSLFSGAAHLRGSPPRAPRVHTDAQLGKCSWVGPGVLVLEKSWIWNELSRECHSGKCRVFRFVTAHFVYLIQFALEYQT